MKTRKKKSDTEIDRLRNELREQKNLNRSLMKRIKKLDRNYKEVQESEEDVLESINYERVSKCPDCSKGSLTIVILAGRQFSRCSLCEYRTKAVRIS